MLTLYYLRDSRASRILWLLEEMGVAYTLKTFERVNGRAPKELLDTVPTKRSPVIDDDGTIVAESGLIVEYLVNKYGKNTELAPKDEKDDLRIKQGLYACEGNLATGLMQLYVFDLSKQMSPWGVSFVVGKVTDIIAKAYALPEVEMCLKDLDTQLKEQGGYFSGGHFSGADIMYDYTIRLLVRKNLVPNIRERFPEIGNWLNKNSERPPFQKMLLAEKGPPTPRM